MTESGAGAAAPMGDEAIDRALTSLRADQERIAASLLDLDAHDGLRLLGGASLTGETGRRWEETKARMALLWRLYDAYRQVLDGAAALRAAHARPDGAVRAELTRLLTGDSVELPGGEIPLDRRTLLGPPKERVTLDEAVALMAEAFERSAEMVAAADAAWGELAGPLGEAEEGWRAAARFAHALSGARRPDLDRLGRELTALRREVRGDPLGLAADAGRLDRLRTAIAALHDELAAAVALRDSYEERAAALEAAVGEVEEAERAALEAAETAARKIEAAGPPALKPRAAGLRHRFAALGALREAGRWTDLAGRAQALEAAIADARERAAEHLRLSSGLLDRRAELRGRLGAYQAKAARLGLAEDETLARLHARARDLLWTAPCDLRAATAAVADYQRAIRASESEAARR